MQLANLFPPPVFFSKVDNFKVIQDELQSSYDKLKFTRFNDVHWVNEDGFAGNVIGSNLKKEIVKNVGLYTGLQSYVYSSWFAKFQKHDYGHVHHHGRANIAGVYYFKLKGSTGNLFFQSPTPGLDGEGGASEIVCEEGELVLFPGWLLHGITTNKSDTDRISVSFNVKYINGQ